MILRLFKDNVFLQIIIILLTWFALWFPTFSPDQVALAPDISAPAYSLLLKWIGHITIINHVLAFVFLMSGALLVNVVMVQFALIPRRSMLPAFFYVLLMSSHPSFLSLNPILIANIFLIMVLRKIYYTSQKDNFLKDVFSAGLFIALASLFVFKAMGFLIAIFFFLIIIRVYSLRHWLVAITGFIIVYIYIFSFYYLADQLPLAVQEYKNFFLNQIFKSNQDYIGFYDYFMYGSVLLLLLGSFFYLLNHIGEKLINVRRMLSVIIWFLIASVLLFLIGMEHLKNEINLLNLPISMILSIYFSDVKKKLIPEIFLMLVLLAIILLKTIV